VVRSAAFGAVLAVTLELLPERIDLIGFVLQLAGLGSLSALALAVARGEDDALYAKYGTLAGAYIGLALFLLLLTAQAVR